MMWEVCRFLGSQGHVGGDVEWVCRMGNTGREPRYTSTCPTPRCGCAYQPTVWGLIPGPFWGYNVGVGDGVPGHFCPNSETWRWKMKLEFPTMAEKAVAEFRTRRVSLSTIARRMGAETVKGWEGLTHTFDDDTSITVTGRGRAHRVETHLP